MASPSPSPSIDPQDDSESTANPDTHCTIEVKSFLTYFKQTPPPSGKGRGREQKEIKKKVFQYEFISGEDGYLGLLRAVLAKHGEAKYHVSARKPYAIKALVPPDKA